MKKFELYDVTGRMVNVMEHYDSQFQEKINEIIDWINKHEEEQTWSITNAQKRGGKVS